MTKYTPRLRELPLGAIRPQGWLERQLRLQADGQTGRLEAIWPDVGPSNGWLGGDGENWERAPYYLDGLVPLAYVLDDAELQAKAQKWIEAILDSQRADGQFGPAGNDDWWPRMVALKVLTQYADATADDRVAPFLYRYFQYQRAELPGRPLDSWGKARGADNILSILWLRERMEEGWLLELARLILDQTHDWATFVTRDLPPGPVSTFRHLTHGVNVAMGLKTPAVALLLDNDLGHIDKLQQMQTSLERLHGQVHGVFSGDEWLGGRDPHHGVETCQVVELMFTLEQLARVLGDGRYGDQLEQVAFNLLAAANDPRMLAHQYHQQANQVLVSFATRDWSFSGPDANVFGLEPHFGCCTANLHQGWPKLVRSLWMRSSADDALTAIAYAPCTVRAAVDGQPVQLDVQTSYPFEETIEIRIGVDEPTELTLRLRIPQWCDDPVLVVQGSQVPVSIDDYGFAAVRSTFADSDVVRLELPMQLRAVPRDKGAVGLRLGPLVMVHAIGEVWRPVPDHAGLAEWEITPRSFWNLGLWSDDPEGIASWPIERKPVEDVPFTASGAPVIIHGKGAQLHQWRMQDDSAGPLPESPVPTSMPILPMRLLPYGSARLRIAEFPTIHPTAPA
ncbi:beta-L-arabinofuranosidase domain-containing protein [Kribbella sp. NPDC023855]|uniref:beta-L-arabinofuranosidase domain-containing protein n=1 Tax=Kribbella sp. NPDC023855 TaxID=3154698 RepID=UPI0033D0D74F